MRQTVVLGIVMTAVLVLKASAEERTERFDRDPGWEGVNNRVEKLKPRRIRQDFGWSRTGEIGGWITPAAETAYYAKKIPSATLEDVLTASGTIRCPGPRSHVLVGFFNSGTVNEWRTPNTIVLRISGRGEVFYAWLEYATSRWRAGGDEPQSFPMVRDAKTGRKELVGFPSGEKVYRWRLKYDPKGNKGQGVIQASIGEHTAICNLQEGHKADGSRFDRFGMMNVSKHADDGGEVWLGEVSINGKREELGSDPGWEGRGNRRTHETKDIRPRFDFGYSLTQYAGGAGKGELGGLVFRGDCRYPERMASYGDRLEELTLEKPLRAKGKVSLRRGVTDSTVLIGFYNSQESMKANAAQDSGIPRSFLGVAIEGPSREGFFFAPVYRVAGEGQGHAIGIQAPRIYPDGKVHDWSLEYSPTGGGEIRVTLGRQSVRMGLAARDRKTGARFDRFGIVTTWIDGNGQQVYLDDLSYTCKQE